MHIEPGVVDGAKLALSYATATASFGILGKMAWDTVKNDGGVVGLAMRSVATTLIIFAFFEVFPHFSAGVSEVHFILGSTLLLVFGAGPAAIGMALGLLMQGLTFAPTDLPQYTLNVTTLIMSLWAMHELARRMIPQGTAFADIGYADVLKLSAVFQGTIVAWVAFWTVYGQGFGAETLAALGTFSVAYMSVIILEPLVDLAVLAIAKNYRDGAGSLLFTSRLTSAA